MRYAFKITSDNAVKVADIASKDFIDKSVTVDEDGKNIIQFEAEQKFTTEKVTDEFGKLVDTQKDNLDALITEAKKVATGKIEYHVCTHDSEINTPCGGWRVVDSEVVKSG